MYNIEVSPADATAQRIQLPSVQGGCFNLEYPSTTHFKLQSRDTSYSSVIFIAVVQSFELSHIAMCKIIGHLENKLWATEISRDLILNWISKDFSILQQRRAYCHISRLCTPPVNSLEYIWLLFLESGYGFRVTLLVIGWRIGADLRCCIVITDVDNI